MTEPNDDAYARGYALGYALGFVRGVETAGSGPLQRPATADVATLAPRQDTGDVTSAHLLLVEPVPA
jgi:hypothetical protein